MTKPDFTVNSDDIYDLCFKLYGLPDGWLGPASGSVWEKGFSRKWTKTPGLTLSRRKKQHAAMLSNWTLNQAYRHPVTMPPKEEVLAELMAEDGVVAPA
jgi:hypothetical protein